jgi:hypothetical protein
MIDVSNSAGGSKPKQLMIVAAKELIPKLEWLDKLRLAPPEGS